MSSVAFDERDALLLADKIKAREAIDGPRIGDYIKMLDGSLRRFTHDWCDSIQTTALNHDGSFFLGLGYASFSGSLDPGVERPRIERVPGEVLSGRFWFFHHDSSGAARGVNCEITCRVFRERFTYAT